MKDNRGYSLVELIVTVLIMSMVVGIVVIIISTSRQSYEIINTDATLQTEAQAASNYVYDLVLESEDCGIVDVPSITDIGGTVVTPAGEIDDTLPEARFLWVKCVDGYHFILWERNSMKLRYCQSAEVPDGAETFAVRATNVVKDCAVCGDPYSLLAEYVTELSFSREEGSKLNEIMLKFKYNGKDYQTRLDVAGRNAN